MTTKMLINGVDPEELRVAIIKDGLLENFYVETSRVAQKMGNIYKGIVERVEPSLQACFVNYGSDKNGFLPAAEIHPEYYAESTEKRRDAHAVSIEKMVRKGQEVLVQVTREMPGRKGAQLTTYISLAGRFLVLMPGGSGGVSRKIEDEDERKRLKQVMQELKVPEDIGYIVRTSAYKQTKRVLSLDLNLLLRMWKTIREGVKDAPALSLVHKEEDLCLRTLRDYFTADVSEVLVDDKETYAKVKKYMKIIAPRHERRVKLYKDPRPIFTHYEVEKQIQIIYENRVKLKSGGSVIIDQTEALIAVDVNSGSRRPGRDVEETAFQTNKEAAQEIARQLRLRDMGGLIVIDFIDMKDRKHNREIEKLMRENTKDDRAKIDFAHISKFGLMELSRERLRPSLESRSYQACTHCEGRGIVLSVEAAALSFLRKIWMGLTTKGVIQVKGLLPIEVATYLQNKKRKDLIELETRYGVEILLQGDPTLAPGSGKLELVSENGTSAD